MNIGMMIEVNHFLVNVIIQIGTSEKDQQVQDLESNKEGKVFAAYFFNRSSWLQQVYMHRESSPFASSLKPLCSKHLSVRGNYS